MDGEQPTAVEAFVAAAREATGEAIDPFDVFGFGDSPEMADELAALVLTGTKRATATLLAEYEADETPVPQPGDWSVVLDSEGDPVAVIRMVDVRVVPFAQVDAVFAWDEGEGDRSLDHWRRVHRDFFGRSDLPFGDDSSVVCERFEVVYPR